MHETLLQLEDREADYSLYAVEGFENKTPAYKKAKTGVSTSGGGEFMKKVSS
jgi:hypothetical protein